MRSKKPPSGSSAQQTSSTCCDVPPVRSFLSSRNSEMNSPDISSSLWSASRAGCRLCRSRTDRRRPVPSTIGRRIRTHSRVAETLSRNRMAGSLSARRPRLLRPLRIRPRCAGWLPLGEQILRLHIPGSRTRGRRPGRRERLGPLPPRILSTLKRRAERRYPFPGPGRLMERA